MLMPVTGTTCARLVLKKATQFCLHVQCTCKQRWLHTGSCWLEPTVIYYKKAFCLWTPHKNRWSLPFFIPFLWQYNKIFKTTRGGNLQIVPVCKVFILENIDWRVHVHKVDIVLICDDSKRKGWMGLEKKSVKDLKGWNWEVCHWGCKLESCL